MRPFCAAIDWGTSSFRLWLLAEDGAILAERRSAEGMMSAASTGFESVLETHLSALDAEASLPVIVCGMAGARQGWREAGYLDTPAELNALAENASAIEGYPRDVRILPGIAQRDAAAPDVMRGEETQLAGLIEKDMRSGLVCMPGTHSKWVELDDGKVARFATFMTGELFAVLSRHSILESAIDPQSDAAATHNAFNDALKTALISPKALPNLLFTLRSSQLLGFSSQKDGAARLSGFLIGTEIAGAFARFGHPEKVVLIGEGPLGETYANALSAMGLEIDRRNAGDAVRYGLFSAARKFWSA